ncbi:hypothetical protein LPJ77_003776 [Coemansia sp. RSA 2523]|nr:hypothetical protein LPJ77_003776 [Coemansia sp. RSA 2523]KAJ2833043.1 hypothetical protein J3B01_004594 [Coemansia erecta]
MDKLLSMLSSGAQTAPLFAGHDDSNMYILPSFADNYEAWAYPDTQQAIFEDWITTAAPPPTALASPALTQQHMQLSPALSSPSSASSIHSSPVLTGDIALSLASALQPSASMSVADYAAVLFPDLAASLSTTLASPSEQALGFAKPTLAPQPYARTEASLTSWATDFAGMLEASPSASPSESPAPGTAQPQVAEEQRKRRDCEFLDSLPPQLKLKRRRTSNTKQKEKILAELLLPALPTAAVVTAPMKSAVAAKPASEEDELSGDEDGLDAAALKRKKNTDAARRSRMRKILRIETLEGRVSDLETENAQLLQRIAQLEAERLSTA